MKAAIDIHDPFIERLHAVVMEGMGCTLCDIIGPKDKAGKVLVVFILVQFYPSVYSQRAVAVAYSLNYYYVPTVVSAFAEFYGKSERMQEIIQEILNKLEEYEGEIRTA